MLRIGLRYGGRDVDLPAPRGTYWNGRSRFPSTLDGRTSGNLKRWRLTAKPVASEVVGLASVYERVRSIVAERLGVDEEKVTMEAEFIGDLNADSLDLVEVIMAMEQEFDLEIKDEEAENIRSVADAVNFIEEHSN